MMSCSLIRFQTIAQEQVDFFMSFLQFTTSCVDENAILVDRLFFSCRPNFYACLVFYCHMKWISDHFLCVCAHFSLWTSTLIFELSNTKTFVRFLSPNFIITLQHLFVCSSWTWCLWMLTILFFGLPFEANSFLLLWHFSLPSHLWSFLSLFSMFSLEKMTFA